SFLMFGVRGRSWLALGAPVGRRDERLELMWRFRELADSHAARPGFYALSAGDLPRAWRKAAEEGATFEIVEGEALAAMMPTLQAISDEWLAHHAGGEKGF